MPSFHMPAGDRNDAKITSNPVLERIQSQWQFTSSELRRSPSILDGMPPAQEQANRSKGVNFITQVGILLKLPQLTLATASVYLHRFFMRHSMVDLPNRPGLHHYSVAATALFLATKVEENCRKMRELVVACCRVAQKQPNLVVDEQSKEYWKWRDTILHNEDLLLEALCFDLQIEKPYQILYDFLCVYKVQDNKHLRNTSWAFLNDSHITPMCLMFSPRTTAGAAFYAGAKWADMSFPDDRQGRPWWEHLDLDIFEIQQACSLMAEVYENSALPRKNQEGYFKDDGSAFDKTRSAAVLDDQASPARSLGTDSQGVKRDREEFDHDGENAPRINVAPPTKEVLRHTQEQDMNGSRSPKRQRRDEPNGNSESHQNGNRLTTHHSLPQRPPSNLSEIEDVQQRIDAIVNAAVSPEQVHPPLSRRTSNQQRPRPGPRRRSSSICNRPRPPSSQDNARPEYGEPRTSSGRGHGYDPSLRGGDGHQPERPPSRGQHDIARPTSQQSHGPVPAADADMDDSEKVDYGSEEGEL